MTKERTIEEVQAEASAHLATEMGAMGGALNAFKLRVWRLAYDKGFHGASRTERFTVNVPTHVANIHAEVSELFEAFRNAALDLRCDKAEKMKENGLPILTSLEEELADIFIRVCDFAEDYEVDLERAVAIKHAYNSTRKLRNGGKIA